MKRSLSIFMSAVLIITVCSVFFAGITASAVPYGKDQVSGNNYQMNLGSLAYLEGHIYVGGADQIASTKNYSHTHLFHVYDYDGAEYMDPASDPLKNVASDYYDANGFHCFEQTFQDDNSAYAIYNFDRYNSTAADLSQINATIKTSYKSFGTRALHAFGIGSSTQKMMAGFSSVNVNGYTYTLTDIYNGNLYSAGGPGYMEHQGDTPFVRESAGSARINGPVPNVGESVTFRVGTRVAVTDVWNNLWNIYQWTNIIVNCYDTTALRSAMANAQSVPADNHYTAESYSAFSQAYTNAVNVFNNSTDQTMINNAASSLTAAQNNLTVQKYTITFKNGDTVMQSCELEYGAIPVYSGSTPTKAADSNNHYTFSGWNPSVNTVTDAAEYSADFTSEAHSFTYQYNASQHWQVCSCGYESEKSNHIFDADGKCICGCESTSKADYTAVEAAKAAAPKITVYYTDESVAALNDAVNAVEYNLYAGKQAQVDAMAANINSAISGLTVKQYNISVSGEGCSISQTLPAGSHYYLATVRAPKTNSAGEYFTYWKDGNGEIVGTYRNYSFYVVSDVMLTPVFTAPSSYESARQEAVIAGRILDVKTSKDGTVVMFGEHSVSSTEGSINGHGIIATTDSSLANEASMNKDNENPGVLNFMASTTSATLTGIVEAQAKMTGSTVWVRTYIIDKNGETEYGDIKSYTINANSNAADDEIIMLDSQSYDLTAENEGNDAPAQVDEPTEESNDIIAVILDMLKTIAARIVNYIKLALAIIK